MTDLKRSGVCAALSSAINTADALFRNAMPPRIDPINVQLIKRHIATEAPACRNHPHPHVGAKSNR